MSSEAIKLEHITKIYKLYGRNRDRLKDSLGLTKKKCYTEHYALRDVSMEIHQGETVGIIGVNGSGKSTILKIITGVLAPPAARWRLMEESLPFWNWEPDLIWNTPGLRMCT